MPIEAPAWVRQLKLIKNLPLPEFRYTGSPPNRTIVGFVRSGGALQAVDILGSTYIPNYDPSQYEEFIAAYQWIRSPKAPENKEPNWIANHYYKLLVLADMVDDLRHDQAKLTRPARQRLVAFSPSSPDFVTDLRAVTWPLFDNMRANCVELTSTRYGKPYDTSSGFSATHLLRTTGEFYFSGGAHNREQASDLIIGQMLFHYWLKLRKRAIAGRQHYY